MEVTVIINTSVTCTRVFPRVFREEQKNTPLQWVKAGEVTGLLQ